MALLRNKRLAKSTRKFSKNRKKSFSFLIILVVILAAGYYFYNQKSSAAVTWTSTIPDGQWYIAPATYNENSRKKSFRITCQQKNLSERVGTEQLEVVAQIPPTSKYTSNYSDVTYLPQAFIRQHSNVPRGRLLNPRNTTDINEGMNFGSISYWDFWNRIFDDSTNENLINDRSRQSWTPWTNQPEPRINNSDPLVYSRRSVNTDTFKIERHWGPITIYGHLTCYPGANNTYTVGNVNRILIKSLAGSTSKFNATVTVSQ